MTKTRQRPRVLALAGSKALRQVHAALGERGLQVQCLDIRRLRREYGTAVADEVVRQLVRAS